MSKNYLQSLLVKSVLRVIEEYVQAYLGGQDIPMDQNAVIDLAEVIVSADAPDIHINRTRRIFGPQRGDRHYRSIMKRIRAVPGLEKRLEAARRTIDTSLDPTATSFYIRQVTEKELNAADGVAIFLNLLDGNVIIHERTLGDKEKKQLKKAVGKIFDLSATDADIQGVLLPLRDKIKGMLVDMVTTMDDFKTVLHRVGTVEHKNVAVTPEETIRTLSSLMTSGGKLDRLPSNFGIRAKALELLMETGATLIMKEGKPVIRLK